MLRRVLGDPKLDDPVLSYGELCLDTRKRIVTCADQRIELTRAEYEILEHLWRNAGRVQSKKTIADSYQRDPMYVHSALGRPAQTGDTRSSAVIHGDWKLIQWYSLEDENVERTELFNLSTDPYEKQDRYAEESEKAA